MAEFVGQFDSVIYSALLQYSELRPLLHLITYARPNWRALVRALAYRDLGCFPSLLKQYPFWRQMAILRSHARFSRPEHFLLGTLAFREDGRFRAVLSNPGVSYILRFLKGRQRACFLSISQFRSSYQDLCLVIQWAAFECIKLYLEKTRLPERQGSGKTALCWAADRGPGVFVMVLKHCNPRSTVALDVGGCSESTYIIKTLDNPKALKIYSKAIGTVGVNSPLCKDHAVLRHKGHGVVLGFRERMRARTYRCASFRYLFQDSYDPVKRGIIMRMFTWDNHMRWMLWDQECSDDERCLFIQCVSKEPQGRLEVFQMGSERVIRAWIQRFPKGFEGGALVTLIKRNLFDLATDLVCLSTPSFRDRAGLTEAMIVGRTPAPLLVQTYLKARGKGLRDTAEWEYEGGTERAYLEEVLGATEKRMYHGFLK